MTPGPGPDEASPSGMLVSVVVCTRNRPENLRRALASLRAMRESEGCQWEVIVVDNGSTDHTKAVAECWFALGPPRGKYVVELAPGSAAARNRGVAEAAGDIIAVTDDDCIVDADWLKVIAEEFTRDPDLDLIGGRLELFDSADHPVSVVVARQRCAFTSPGQLFCAMPGANFAFRRRVAETVGAFDTDFGAGARFRSAEDQEFFYRCLKRRLRMMYVPEALVYHNHGRRTEADVRAVNRGYAFGRGAFYCKYIMSGDTTVLKLAYWECLGMLDRLKKDLAAGKPIAPVLRHLTWLLRGAFARLLYR